MDNRKWLSGASASAPIAPASPSAGYPTGGNSSTGTLPTNPGPYWPHAIGEELRAVIVAGGQTPSLGTLNQLLVAMNVLFAPNGSYAPINSPAFIGVPLSPTPAAGDNTTKIASTAFVTSAIASIPPGATVLSSGGVPYGLKLGALMVQFGFHAGSSGNTFSFTTAFPTACLAIIAGNSVDQGSSVDTVYAYPLSRTQYYFSTTRLSAGGSADLPGYWVAFGY